MPANKTPKDVAAEKWLDRIMPRLAERLRERLPPEVKGMAEEAAGTVGLDDVSLAVLADWLEENRFVGLAKRVRRLHLEEGDLLVIQPDHQLTAAAMGELRESVGRLEDKLEARGKRVVFVVMPHGLNLRQIRSRGREVGNAED